ncbi:TIGR00730 family Rossman fold protein, partial [Xanthomonas perforans]
MLTPDPGPASCVSASAVALTHSLFPTPDS